MNTLESPLNLNNVTISENIQEFNDDKMKIKEDKMDKIIDRKRKNSFDETFNKKFKCTNLNLQMTKTMLNIKEHCILKNR